MIGVQPLRVDEHERAVVSFTRLPSNCAGKVFERLRLDSTVSDCAHALHALRAHALAPLSLMIPDQAAAASSPLYCGRFLSPLWSFACKCSRQVFDGAVNEKIHSAKGGERRTYIRYNPSPQSEVAAHARRVVGPSAEGLL